ncbi:hypothetical protein TYRP_013992 [Tyrophagus putrescentiae]|nr:hypothetical protein TYRP_013992 [Tyrophagus putrescentiae]
MTSSSSSRLLFLFFRAISMSAWAWLERSARFSAVVADHSGEWSVGRSSLMICSPPVFWETACRKTGDLG